MAQTMNREFQPDPDADLLRLPNASVYGSNSTNIAFSNWRTLQGSHPSDGYSGSEPGRYSSVHETLRYRSDLRDGNPE
jgi:hypothetical protein